MAVAGTELPDVLCRHTLPGAPFGSGVADGAS